MVRFNVIRQITSSKDFLGRCTIKLSVSLEVTRVTIVDNVNRFRYHEKL